MDWLGSVVSGGNSNHENVYNSGFVRRGRIRA